jgi:hypothetical protein
MAILLHVSRSLPRDHRQSSARGHKLARDVLRSIMAQHRIEMLVFLDRERLELAYEMEGLRYPSTLEPRLGTQRRLKDEEA